MFALTAVLSACASTKPVSEECERRAAYSHTCIPVEQLADWEPLDESTLLLWTHGATRAHLLRLGRPLEELLLADDVDLADADSDRLICPCGRDGVVDFISGRSARIIAIEYLSEQRTAELLGGRSTVL